MSIETTLFADASVMHGTWDAGEYTLIDTQGDEHHALLIPRDIPRPRHLSWKLRVDEAHKQIEKVT